MDRWFISTIHCTSFYHFSCGRPLPSPFRDRVSQLNNTNTEFGKSKRQWNGVILLINVTRPRTKCDQYSTYCVIRTVGLPLSLCRLECFPSGSVSLQVLTYLPHHPASHYVWFCKMHMMKLLQMAISEVSTEEGQHRLEDTVVPSWSTNFWTVAMQKIINTCASVLITMCPSFSTVTSIFSPSGILLPLKSLVYSLSVALRSALSDTSITHSLVTDSDVDTAHIYT